MVPILPILHHAAATAHRGRLISGGDGVADRTPFTARGEGGRDAWRSRD
eukprot:gene14761-biopygen20128